MAVCNILQEDYADGYQTPPARLKFDPFETCETCDACQGTGDAGADRDCRVCGGRGWRDDPDNNIDRLLAEADYYAHLEEQS